MDAFACGRRRRRGPFQPLTPVRNLVFFGIGIGFVLMGAGLFALTLRKSAKPAPANPTKTQQREQAELAEETKKMRLGAGGIAGLGVVFLVFSFL